MSKIQKIAPPAIPHPTRDYQQSNQSEINNVLRLFFNRVMGALNSIISPVDGSGAGAGTLYFPHGAFSCNTTQTVAAPATPTLIDVATTDYAVGMEHVAGDGVKIYEPGLYNVQFSAQVTNDNSQAHDFDIWIRHNGSDMPRSASVGSIVGTHGGQPGYMVIAANFYVEVAAGDHFEFWWAASSTNVKLNNLPAITTPFTSPAAPAFIVTVSFVSNI